MAYINSTRTVVNGVGTDLALAGSGNLFTISGSLGGTKTLTLSDGFINNGAPEENLIIPVLFANGHNDLGPTLYLEITVTGVTNPIPVVSNQQGTLAPIPHHEMVESGSTVYKVIGANTILGMYYTSDYDGNGTAAFVVVGNPLVLSSSDYSIYADGQVNSDVLSDFEGVTVGDSQTNAYTCQYDGFIFLYWNAGNTTVDANAYVSTDDGATYTKVGVGYNGNANSGGTNITLPINKGDKVYIDFSNRIETSYARFYKFRTL